jgi:SNF2 family DNA or RNA helicase
MKPVDRNSAVLDFTDNPDCKVMLVSLKAGNSGLNLVAASHVILFDPFWNPYIEEQAIDRAHRMGQLREVKVHRILIPETVEDRIIELQDKKRQLIDGALDEKAAKNVARLSARELGYLFVRPLATLNPPETYITY